MMTAEKLDEADALHGQYGKSESIKQPVSCIVQHITGHVTAQLLLGQIFLS